MKQLKSVFLLGLFLVLGCEKDTAIANETAMANEQDRDADITIKRDAGNDASGPDANPNEDSGTADGAAQEPGQPSCLCLYCPQETLACGEIEGCRTFFRCAVVTGCMEEAYRLGNSVFCYFGAHGIPGDPRGACAHLGGVGTSALGRAGMLAECAIAAGCPPQTDNVELPVCESDDDAGQP